MIRRNGNDGLSSFFILLSGFCKTMFVLIAKKHNGVLVWPRITKLTASCHSGSFFWNFFAASGATASDFTTPGVPGKMKESRSMLSSILANRCPRCREGKMFAHALYSKKFMAMNRLCPCCGQSFVLEPGFFLGAAFVSYAINGTLLITAALSLYHSDATLSITAMVFSTVLVVFGLLPITLRLSKAVWIHLFIRYEGPCDAIPKKS